jgi:DNA modification methylase
MPTSKKPASSSKTKKHATLSGEATKSFEDNTRDSSPSAQSDMKKSETRVEIKPARGRPMLTWVGKKPLRHVTAYPAQLVESFNAQSSTTNRKSEIWSDWPKDIPQSGLLFHGDNKDVLAYLLANGFRGKVKLIYIDPPFDSGADYVRQVVLREAKNIIGLEGEGYTLGEQIQYADIWTNDTFLQFMYERLSLIKELLSEDGSLFVHCDWRKNQYLRLLLDEIFGSENFRNEITWVRSTNPKGSQHKSNRFDVYTDTILYYACSPDTPIDLDAARIPLTEEELKEKYFRTDEKGFFYDGPIVSSFSMGPRPTLVYEYKGYTPPPSGWRVRREVLERIDQAGDLGWTASGKPFRKLRPGDDKGKPIGNFWDDISLINSQAGERVGYPTQKPEALVRRIVMASTNPGDLMLDCFIGSGTTAVVAQKLGRRWIGADINKGAVQTTTKRLQGAIQEQVKNAKGKTQALPGMGAEEIPTPAQLGFAVYRVNDYDLQIQHNEAFNLAVEHLGMTRTKTDAYFDGTLGKKLVKIVPFNHPVTPLDLEEVKNELKNRPEEERDILVVGLGKEVAVEAWLDEWNKLRKQGSIPNKLEVIELRSDPKYGGFFTHEPAKAKVSFKRNDKGAEITIDDFISPTILERLRQQNKDNPLFQPQVSDWRSMVDSVMIDSNYDGNVFNITLADVPQRKNDLVEGKYAVEANKGAAVAVKVTDMLGEEVLVVRGI